jgi:hypothetical protein
MKELTEQIKIFFESGSVEGDHDFHLMKELTLKYPYYQGLLFYYLKALYLGNTPEFYPELRRLAPRISDRKALFYSIFSEEYSMFFKKTGKTELSGDRTGLLLGTFFNQLNDSPEKNASMGEDILNAGIVSVDYFSYLKKIDGPVTDFPVQETNPTQQMAFRHQDIIDGFIEKSDRGEDFKIRFKQKQMQPTADPIEPQLEDDSLEDSMFFTETLSRIYIKQKKYEKAYRIIKQLSLNYPGKNIYFADQIRFLEKLISNSSNNK